MPRSPFASRAPLALVLLLMAPSCATVPYTGRRQLAIVSADEERALGTAAHAAMLRQARISDDRAAAAVVEAVGRRLAAVADRPDWAWEFTLLDDPTQVNAWALPGGKVGVYTGILPIAEDDAGLAAILGHEVAHAIAHHGAERAGQGTLVDVLGAGVGLAAAVAGLDGSSAMQLFGLGTDVGVLLPFSRSQESEADEIGLILMARAGYDPRAAVALWERMAVRAADGAGAGSFLSTHPSHGSRIERMRAALPRALSYYAGGDGRTRPLPGIAPASAASPSERDVARAMQRLDRLALDPARAELVAFAIASELDVEPDAVVTVLADGDLSAGEGALAFVLAAANRRPVDDLVATAARTSWQELARTSGVDLATVTARLDRIATAASPARGGR